MTSLDTGLTDANVAVANLSNAGTGLVTQDATSHDILVANKVGGSHVNFAATGGTARELTGVAAGTTLTSAVNVSQLQPMAAALGGGAGVSAAGVFTAPTYTVQKGSQNNVGSA